MPAQQPSSAAMEQAHAALCQTSPRGMVRVHMHTYAHAERDTCSNCAGASCSQSKSQPKSDAEETTEKYGLEAGLWKVCAAW